MTETDTFTHVYVNDHGYGTYGVVAARTKTAQGHDGWFEVVSIIEATHPHPMPVGSIFKPVDPATITTVQDSGQGGQQP